MSQERMEVLKMVADKVISVEDAERLLRALDDGDRGRSEQSHARKGKGSWVSVMDELGEALSGIGAMVPDVVRDAMDGVVVEVGGAPEAGLADAELTDGAFEIPEGARLEIRDRRREGVRTGSGLVLRSVEGKRCRLKGEGLESASLGLGEDRARIVWGGEALEVEVPAAVAELQVRLLGGDVEGRAVACSTKVRNLGGRISFTEVKAPFDLKTMGGEIRLELAEGLEGESRALTMGGDISATVPEGLGIELHAVTMAGSIDVSPELSSSRKAGASVQQKAVIRNGDGSTSLRLKTMGGTIRVKKG